MQLISRSFKHIYALNDFDISTVPECLSRAWIVTDVSCGVGAVAWVRRAVGPSNCTPPASNSRWQPHLCGDGAMYAVVRDTNSRAISYLLSASDNGKFLETVVGFHLLRAQLQVEVTVVWRFDFWNYVDNLWEKASRRDELSILLSVSNSQLIAIL